MAMSSVSQARWIVSRWADARLEARADELEALDELTDSQSALLEAIELEQDARDGWNSDDARVREAFGNYR